MYLHRTLRIIPASLPFIFVSLFLLAACGSNSSTTGSSSLPASAATATACAQTTRPASAFKTANGTLKSINGSTLVLTNQRGTDVTVTYSDSTRFTQESIVAASSLQEGTSVRIAVTSTGGTYAATTILVLSGVNGLPRGTGTPGTGLGRGNNPCINRVRSGNATPGTGNNNFRGLIGTISQLSGDTLTITDTAGTDYTVTITPQTQIVETKNVTSAVLQVGMALTVVGQGSGQGAIAANTVAILLNLPKRTPNATPTPTT